MKTAQNYFTGNEYHGKNSAFLNLEYKTKKYEENQWATYRQWADGGYQVQKGQHGTGIQVVREDEDKGKTVIKYYRVFNLAQVAPVDNSTENVVE